ncbi:beta-1,4-mannosyl-glycoprotein 4-beta-N-acetylglucosaminyltransferase [Leptopilina heterotoma]|uniref:beta-1,4-mannosyl-glycoprotein 4-beta-N-acetylglucosaminyltransferase n=1 Tax=Leptopilina heterotoma TaxID=63436 RepID=UPI001CAA38CB|nr:beta-1,4-mannosyl-glycoprotein 4-beta-N-acetylglucosaminyltransferase [Leptopilina heterotoma]
MFILKYKTQTFSRIIQTYAMHIRTDGKIILLFTLLILQVMIVIIYVINTTPSSKLMTATRHEAVSFVDIQSEEALYKNRLKYDLQLRTQTVNGEFTLKDTKTSAFFENYADFSCWKDGVNDRIMRKNCTRKCVCNQGWHGSDCGQPEVVWRAIMASKQLVKLKQRKWMRRIIYTLCINQYNSAISEIIVQELYSVVDLFIICDSSNSEFNFNYSLAKGLLKSQQRKILYINTFTKARKPFKLIFKYIWDKIHNTIKNIRDDDIIVMTDPEEILNSKALMFLKTYDGWSQPIGFRLRWLVFGFFWQHPLKTTIKKGAFTIGFMQEAYRNNNILLQKELVDENIERDELGLVIGDLNHYGGWYCHYCQVPKNIMFSIKCKTNPRNINSEAIIDISYIEELIGMGMWLNGKTSLLRVPRSQDIYFAPEIVLNNSIKYDWLLQNFYVKVDYY